MADDTNKIDAGSILVASVNNAISAEQQRVNIASGPGNPTTDVTSAISQISQYGSVGGIDTAIGDNFFGINHRQTPGVIPINKDVYGLTFFTRPRMNFASPNLRNIRKLTPLLTRDANSIQRIIRNTLDDDMEKTGITCAFVDPQLAFIPLLSNTLQSISGWPDMIAPTFTSAEGQYKESFSYVDGTVKQFGVYNLTANFRNIPGDPITALFMYWLIYMGAVYEGTMVPKMDMLLEHEIDYMTRIYRLVLDPTKTKVQKIACTGASFPLNAPIGAAFDYEHSTPLNQSNAQLSISFQAIGFESQDPILVYEFNATQVYFCDQMADGKRERAFKQVPVQYLQIFNNRGYPRINPDTYILEWWVTNELYNQRLPALTQAQGL